MTKRFQFPVVRSKPHLVRHFGHWYVNYSDLRAWPDDVRAARRWARAQNDRFDTAK